MPRDLSLNEEAVQDLHPTDGVVDTPSEPAAAVKVEVTTQNTAVDHADTITQELENYDVTLQAVENGTAHYFELEDVAKTILAAESIGQADAEKLAAQYPDFVDTVGHTREFSQQPSKTNLKPTQQYLEGKIKSEAQVQCDALTNFVARDLERVKLILGQMKDNQTEELKEKLESLRVKALGDLDRVVKSRAYYVPNKEQSAVLDLRRRALSGHSCEDGVTLGIFPSKEVLVQFDELIGSPAFARLLKSASYGYGLPAERFYAQYDLPQTHYERPKFNYLELLAFLASHTFGETIDDVVAVLEKSVKTFADPEAPINQFSPEEGVCVTQLAELSKLSRDVMNFALSAWGSFSTLDGFATLANVILSHMGKPVEVA